MSQTRGVLAASHRCATARCAHTSRFALRCCTQPCTAPSLTLPPKKQQAQRHANGSDADAVRLTLECLGSERVDPGWVASLYQPQVPAQRDAAGSGKRLARPLFTTGPLVLHDGPGWAPGAARAFAVRARLPARLPPAFRGSAVHYMYQAVAKATITPASSGSGSGSGGSNSKAAAAIAAAAPAATAAASIAVWPRGERRGGDAAAAAVALEGRRSSLAHMGSGAPAPATPSLAAAGSLRGDGGGAAFAAALAAAGGDGAAAAAAAAAAAGAAAAAAAAADQQQEPEISEYKLGVTGLKAKVEEMAVGVDGSLQRLRQPSLTGGGDGEQQQQQQRGPDIAAARDPATIGGGGDLSSDEGGPASSGARLSAQQRASMAPRTYDLRAGEHPLARVTLQPPMDGPVQPGATLGVLLDFSAAHGAAAAAADPRRPACLQVTLMLQSEEVVAAPYARRGAKAAGGSSTVDGGGGGGGLCANRTLHTELHAVTAHLLTSQFTLSVPPNAQPSFRSPLVAHRWSLRFELTLGSAAAAAGAGKGASKRGVEQLVWSLPLVVCPPCS